MHHPAEADDVLDAPQAGELVLADGGAPVHRRPDRRVEPDELPAGLEPSEQIVDVLGLRRGFQVERHSLDEPGNELERLLVGPVKQPGVPRPDPADRLRRDTAVEQPDARVHRGLAAADDRVSARRPCRPDQIVDRDQPNSRLGTKGRNVSRRDRGLQIPGIDDAALHPHPGRLTGQPGHKPATIRPPVQVVGHAEEPDLARRQQILQHPLVVIADLRRRRPLVETCVRPGAVDRVAAQDPRVDTVER